MFSSLKVEEKSFTGDVAVVQQCRVAKSDLNSTDAYFAKKN